MTVSAQDQPAKTAFADYSSEVRFGVVLYGGVSLAIYINGVVNEMYEMACSTPKKGPAKGVSTSTVEYYQRLSWLADNPSLREQYAALIEERNKKSGDSAKEDVWSQISKGPEMRATRLVVDVISGTSAGGINGIFLAKALANGEPFKPLAKLWIEEGNIEFLLNDDKSLHGLDLMHDRTRRPDSLLNGDRMYLKLFKAMEDMSPDKPHEHREPLVDELDLFVTTTDIIGTPVPLRLSGQVVHERRYKQNFHFKYSELASHKHFTAENNGLLAFAARCTSAFPFAFEPMTMARVKDLKPLLARQIDEEWPAYFSYLPAKEVMNKTHVQRPFADGGYLDNKPFSYVAHVLSKRHAVVPVERKLIYVEPAPEEVDPDETPGPNTPVPDAIANSLAALSGIPRYETIREDLQEVLKRNRTIERIDHIVSEGECDLRLALDVLQRRDDDDDDVQVENIPNPFVRILKDTGGRVPPWPEFTREIMVRYYGTAILAYRRLRVSSVTETLGNRLAELWGVDTGSDHLYALTALVRTWRENHYKEKGERDNKNGGANKFKTVNSFLDEFDVEYRIRKIGFLLRQIDHLRRLVQGRMKGALKPGELKLLPQPDRLSIELLGTMGLRLLDEKLPQDSLENALEALHLLKTKLNEAQGKWRIFETKRGREFDNQNRISDELRNQLDNVLEMLLGDRSEASLVLDTVSGGTTRVKLDDTTLKVVLRTRALRESVIERAKGLFKVAKISDKTVLQDQLESCLETLKKKSSLPTAYTILGCPRLWLEERKNAANAPDSDEDDKVMVLVEPVKDSALDSPEGEILRRLLVLLCHKLLLFSVAMSW